MKTPDMTDIRRELRARHAAPEPPPADALPGTYRGVPDAPDTPPPDS